MFEGISLIAMLQFTKSGEGKEFGNGDSCRSPLNMFLMPRNHMQIPTCPDTKEFQC